MFGNLGQPLSIPFRLIPGGRAPGVLEASSEGVAMLEDMLERARRGELQSFAIIGIHHIEGQEYTGGGLTFTRLAYRPVLLLGALELIRERILGHVEK
jgi:hypothetical protein